MNIFKRIKSNLNMVYAYDLFLIKLSYETEFTNEEKKKLNKLADSYLNRSNSDDAQEIFNFLSNKNQNFVYEQSDYGTAAVCREIKRMA